MIRLANKTIGIILMFLMLASSIAFSASQSQLERNKKNVVAFYDLFFNQSNPREAVRKYMGATYTQHNPHLADGKQAFIEFFEQKAKDYPGKHSYIKRVIAEGDYVVLHCYQKWPNSPDWVGINIFRLDKQGKVVEHWDALQAIPAFSKNNNKMY